TDTVLTIKPWPVLLDHYKNHIYSMRLNFVPIEKRRNLQDISGRAFIAHFKVKKLNGAYEIENITQSSR
ncbi:hypothetical protein ACS0TT_20980, partial [Serratia marcescens]